MAKPKRNTRPAAKVPANVKQVLDTFEAQLEFKQNRIRFNKLQPRNSSQAELIRLIAEKRLVFVLGPAGTGKTFISTSLAAEEFMAGEIEHIVITRPQVGCDEEVGFLPGNEGEKFEPWLGPFLDVLEGKMGKTKVASFVKFEQIKANSLSKMRGSTFRNSIVILDEAQNTTVGQMKMFLTRIGEGSRVIINGDLEQSDLPDHVRNGLQDAVAVLADSPSVGFHTFGEEHITRDPLVREIVKAYRKKGAVTPLRKAA